MARRRPPARAQITPARARPPAHGRPVVAGPPSSAPPQASHSNNPITARDQAGNGSGGGPWTAAVPSAVAGWACRNSQKSLRIRSHAPTTQPPPNRHSTATQPQPNPALARPPGRPPPAHHQLVRRHGGHRRRVRLHDQGEGLGFEGWGRVGVVAVGVAGGGGVGWAAAAPPRARCRARAPAPSRLGFCNTWSRFWQHHRASRPDGCRPRPPPLPP